MNIGFIPVKNMSVGSETLHAIGSRGLGGISKLTPSWLGRIYVVTCNVIAARGPPDDRSQLVDNGEQSQGLNTDNDGFHARVPHL